MDVKVGDKVLYGKYSGTEVTIDGEQYLILRESRRPRGAVGVSIPVRQRLH